MKKTHKELSITQKHRLESPEHLCGSPGSTFCPKQEKIQLAEVTQDLKEPNESTSLSLLLKTKNICSEVVMSSNIHI